MPLCFALKLAFFSLWKFCGFLLLQFSFVGAVAFIMFVVTPNHADAQFPGVGSEAPSGVAIQAGDAGYSSGATPANNSDGAASATIGSTPVSSQIDDDGSFGNQASDSGLATLTYKRVQQRKQLFIKKLRLEFAAIELVERKTGLPFSRHDIPRYLDELRSDLKTTTAKARKGKIVEGEMTSIGRDADYIEAWLNHHLDQLLDHAGRPVPKKPFFATMLTLPNQRRISDEKIDALSLKFELADYGEKALQAMGAKSY